MPALSVPGLSLIAFVVLAAVSWIYVIVSGSGISNLFRARAWDNASDFIRSLLGIGMESTPAFLTSEAWLRALDLSIDTLAMSVLAMGIAGIGVLISFMPASRNVASGELGGAPSIATKAAYYVLRGVFVFTRGVPELVWALLIVFVLNPGVLPGALALAVHNYGILGKLSAEIVENLDTRPARALRVAGASKYQVLFYGILPLVLPQFMTYLLYRWEVVIRTTIVVGFVAASGLGQEFRLRMAWFHYDHVLLLLICYLALVVLVDLSAAGLRRLAR
jgi:phosphonate transport system permease protein